MRYKRFLGSVICAKVILGVLYVGDVRALEISEKLSLETNITWVHQWLKHKKGDFEDIDRGSLALDAGLSFKPTEADEFFLRVSFGKEGGIKEFELFKLSPNADDLFSDLKNINGRSRDHLLELWYARTFQLPGNFTLRGTLGIIDSTAFIDDNRFANDELTQFMNEAFVNNPTANLVSYDYGIAFELGKGPVNFRIIGMQSKVDEDLRNYNYYAGQIGYKWETSLGEGNLRLYGFTTNKRFSNWENTKREAKRGWGISVDQDLMKDRLGVFARVGFQDTKAEVDYKNMYSLGLNAKICIPRFRDITFGLGYAYLKAPSKHEKLRDTRVVESFILIPLYEKEEKFSSALTFDWQYMRDRLKEDPTETKGHIWGLRLNFSF